MNAVRARPGTALVVLIDADRDSVETIRRLLDDRLKQEQMNALSSEDRVFIASPKWRIENWIEYLKTGKTDEKSQGPRLDDEGSARTLALDLHRKCLVKSPLLNVPPSLGKACEEWQLFRTKLL